jgi:hypothetical protein
MYLSSLRFSITDHLNSLKNLIESCHHSLSVVNAGPNMVLGRQVQFLFGPL